MRKRLFVFSIDSLQARDLEYLKKKPHFAKILQKCLLVKNVKEIYPTLTYPIHTTMITGVYPGTHGIFHNQRPGISRKNPDWSIMGSDWYWYSDDIKVPTLLDAANQAGLETAAVMWPVMGGQKPKHNLAEIWPDSYEDMRKIFEKACTPDMTELYYDKYLRDFDWEHRTDMDSYSMEIALDTIKRVKPDLMLMHASCLDHTRHVCGDHGVMVDICLDRIDDFLGRALDECEKAGILEDTNIVLTGDHGQIDVCVRLNLNVLLVQYGLIRLDHDGQVADYDAYSFSAGFSTHIMLADPKDHVMEERVLRILEEIASHYSAHMGRIFTRAEALYEEGLDGDFSFVIEGADHVIFDNPVVGEVIVDNESAAGYKGMHGHHPSKGPKPPFIVYGPAIQEPKLIESGSMLSVCPTLAKLLEVKMQGMMGEPWL